MGCAHFKRISKIAALFVISFVLASFLYSFYLQRIFEVSLEKQISYGELMRDDYTLKIILLENCERCTFHEKKVYDEYLMRALAVNYSIFSGKMMQNEGFMSSSFLLILFRPIEIYKRQIAVAQMGEAISSALEASLSDIGMSEDDKGFLQCFPCERRNIGLADGFSKKLANTYDDWETNNPGIEHNWGEFEHSERYDHFLQIFHSEMKSKMNNSDTGFVFDDKSPRKGYIENILFFNYVIEENKTMASNMRYLNTIINPFNPSDGIKYDNNVVAIFYANLYREIKNNLERLCGYTPSVYIREYLSDGMSPFFFIIRESFLLLFLTMVIYLLLHFLLAWIQKYT